MSHEFVYSLLCHDKPLNESTVFAEAYKLNTPLWAVTVEKPIIEVPEGFPKDLISPLADVPNLTYFELIGCENCQVTAFKRCEKIENSHILRIAELRGEECMAII